MTYGMTYPDVEKAIDEALEAFKGHPVEVSHLHKMVFVKHHDHPRISLDTDTEIKGSLPTMWNVSIDGRYVFKFQNLRDAFRFGSFCINDRERLAFLDETPKEES